MAAVSEKDKVIKNLRACLISAPSGVLANDLNKDYRSLVGEPIPYQRLGYSTLEEFLQFLPDVTVENRGGQWHVSAKAGDSSQHISKLVQGQKKTSKQTWKAKQNPSVKRAPPPKPQAQYIAPDKLPVKSYPPRGPAIRNDIHGPVKTYSANGSKPKPPQSSKPAAQNQVAPAQRRAPDDLPVTVHPSKPSQPTQSKLAANFTAFLESTRSSAPPTRPPLLPTPTNEPDLLLTPVNRSPLQPTPTNRPGLLQTPETQLPTPKVPSEPTKPVQKPPRSSLADRLNVFKKKPNFTSISEAQVLTHNQNGVNGIGNNPSTYSEAVTYESNNEPENFPCGVKVVDPISWSKDKNKKLPPQSLQSPTKSYKNIDFQPYHYDESSFICKLSRYADQQNWPKPDFFVLNIGVGNPRSPENKYMCRVTVNCTPIGTHPSSSSQAVLRGRNWNQPLQPTGSLTQSSGPIQQSSAPVPQSTGAFPLSSVATRHAATSRPVRIPPNMILERTLNQVILLGRFGGYPIKKGTIEHPMVEFYIATHSSYKNEEGEQTQSTDWHRICVFKPSLIEQVFRFLKRGQRIHITGKIVYSSTKLGNVTQNRVSIYADHIIFFEGSPGDVEYDQ